MTSASTPTMAFEEVHVPAEEEVELACDPFYFDDSQVVLKASQITWFPLAY